MDEDLSIINSNTRNEKIKNFLIKNKKKLILAISIFVLLLMGYFGYNEYKNNQKIKISNEFNAIVTEYSETNTESTIKRLIDIINKKDPTYSPLSLYFIIDNKLISDHEQIANFFDVLINKIDLEKEIKNLIIYKKALYVADRVNEGELLNTLGPIINTESIWKSHALYLIAEFFYSKNEKEKSKEFFNQIISLSTANEDIKQRAQIRLIRDLSE